MKFKVAGHIFQIRGIGDCMSVLERYGVSYGPFVYDGHGQADEELLFDMELSCDAVEWEGAEKVYSNDRDVEAGHIRTVVYRGAKGHYFEFSNPQGSQVNARLAVSDDFRSARLSLHGNDIDQWAVFNTAVNFCYLLSSAERQTLLVHASCVSYRGKAYLFLGKSGTGKSTHSRMWLNSLEGAELMNDDHPVIRISSNGTPVAYGSPWSGKTRCYKNVEAPVGGVVRISRASYNKARRLSVIESYGSLITSCSGMTWEKKLADGRDRSIQGLIRSVPCWVMECLPDEDAAIVCSKAVVEG